MKKKILFVDDEPSIRMLMEELLSEAGYIVDLAEGGTEALEKIKAGTQYDLLILDVNMPKMDGISLHRKIRTEFPQLKSKYLFSTGNPTEELRSISMKNGYEYIAKPFVALDLLGKISVLLDNKTAHEVGVETNVRSEGRYPWSAYCHIYEEEDPASKSLTAKTLDISKHGVKIRYSGDPLLPGRNVNVFIMSMHINRAARVVWSKTMDMINVVAGLHLMEPIELPSPAININS